jgi:hypothetical protein
MIRGLSDSTGLPSVRISGLSDSGLLKQPDKQELPSRHSALIAVGGGRTPTGLHMRLVSASVAGHDAPPIGERSATRGRTEIIHQYPLSPTALGCNIVARGVGSVVRKVVAAVSDVERN